MQPRSLEPLSHTYRLHKDSHPHWSTNIF